MHSVISAEAVSYEFPNGSLLFSNLTFSLSSGRTALVGPNGAGKTTLARLIAGELEWSRGKLQRLQPVIYFSQREVAPSITIEEWLASHYQWTEVGEKLLQGLDREKVCSTLSGGEWMRVRLASVLDDCFLILDEPTNDLDREGRRVVADLITHHPAGILLISHDRACLELCNQVWELSNQGLSKFGVGWSDYLSLKSAERKGLARRLDKAKQERERVREARRDQMLRQKKRNRRGVELAARGGMPKILIGARKRRAQVTTGQIDQSTSERAEEAVAQAYQAYSKLKQEPVMYAGLMNANLSDHTLIAEARDFNVRMENWTYAQPLNFSWRGRVRVAIRGANGAGKSTLLKVITQGKGEFPTTGFFKVGNVNSLFIGQNITFANEALSVLEYVRADCRLTENETRNALAKFLFAKYKVFQKLNSLSGGERLRVALASGILSQREPQLLILDEPTNNLDLANIEFLEKLVQAFPGAVLVVSHDEVFLKNCDLTTELSLVSGRSEANGLK